MAITRQLRTEREQRRYEQRQTILIGLDWLNEGPPKSRTRIARLIELLKAAEQENEKALQLRRKSAQPLYSALYRAEDEINKILACYRGSRVIEWNEHGELVEGFMENRSLRDESHRRESAWISHVLSLLVKGSIDYLRKCRECEKWFYAITKSQTNCSKNCRQKHYENKPGFKEGRAKYMREKYRPLQRKLDARGKVQANFRERRKKK